MKRKFFVIGLRWIFQTFIEYVTIWTSTADTITIIVQSRQQVN